MGGGGKTILLADEGSTHVDEGTSEDVGGTDGVVHGDRHGATPAPRRAVIGAMGVAGAGLLAAACAPPDTPAPAPMPAVNPPTPVPPTPVDQARLLARRATFGATAPVLARIQALGVNGWLDEQLAPWSLPDAEGRLGAFPTLRQTNSQNDAVRATDQNDLFYQLDHATLLRAVYSERQLYEVMCDFWTNHFNIWRSADWLTHLKTVDNERVIRPNALGKFSDLLMGSAKSPAMLVYLDNYQSRGEPGQQVNENYGRELCELHTLGIVNGQQAYNENDILGVAKVLSGWNINWTNGATKYDFLFADWWHSRDAVSILGGQWSCPARPTWQDYSRNGLGDGESLIRFLAAHPSTARHICFKLVRRFVSDVPPMSLVDRLSGIYTANDTAIVPVLRALFTSPEFAASANLKIKRPIDWLYSSLRVTRASIHDAPRGQASSRLKSAEAALGQSLNERVSPDGFPEKAAYWVSADGLLKRWEYGAKIARNAITDATAAEKVAVDVLSLLPSPLPGTNRDVINTMAESTFQISISTSDQNAICTALRIAPDAAVTTLATDAALVAAAVGLLLAHPQFQHR
jgi:uncharacterized protein (DUF1800 family)